MDAKTNRPLLWEALAAWIWGKAKAYKIPFLSALSAGFLAYMFAFTNKLIVDDEASGLFSKGATATSGRWGLGLMDSIFPNYSMPWIYGLITLLLISVSICIMVSVFRIRSKLLQGLMAGCIIVFPSLLGTMGYMFTVSSYAVAFLLATLAVWLVNAPSKWGFPGALIAMVLSLSIYQAYIAITASLLVLILIQELLQGKDVSKVIRKGFVFLGFLILSLAAYYSATLVLNWLRHIEFNEYAQRNTSIDPAELPGRFALAYSAFLRFFTESHWGIIPTAFARKVHVILMVSLAAMVIFWGIHQKGKQLGRFLLLAALLGILPLAINCMYLFTAAVAIHSLVLFGFAAIYVLAAVVTDACLPLVLNSNAAHLGNRLALHLATLAMALTIIVNVYVANAGYLNLYLGYENTYAFYTSLVADIRMLPGYTENSKLALGGNYQTPAYIQENFNSQYFILGLDSYNPQFPSHESFLKYYVGIDLPSVSEEELAQITTTPEYEEMAVYPYYGSIRMIGDTVVVKLS